MLGKDYLQDLNSAQRAAVEYLEGPELVIAGAGSGKTRVLTYKIVHLLHNGYGPRHIMALTFTNKAAREMRERVEQLVGQEVAQRIWMGTFHSIFARILRMYSEKLGFKSNFTIYEPSDSKSLLKSIIKEKNLDPEQYKPTDLVNVISRAKNGLISPKDYAESSDSKSSNSGRLQIADIYQTYVERCRIAGAMDFDDLLYYMNILLRDFPEVKEELRNYFRYVLVDEYQDTNFAQHLIIYQLCGEKGNFCVVGDDAQSIYSFRGANITNILHLEKHFPTLRVFKLEENYRSTQNIIGAANSLIRNNRNQIPKEIFSRNNPGELIEVTKSYNDYEEAYAVAAMINKLHSRTLGGYSDFAILYRTNVQSRVLEDALRNRNIPYRIYGGLSFYQRAEVKDLVCYFRLIVNSDDDEALRRIINKPSRGIGETTMAKVSSVAVENGVSLWTVISDPERWNLEVNKGTARKLADFATLISGFMTLNDNKSTAYEVATKVVGATGMLRMLQSDRTPESISKKENILELLKAVNDFTTTSLETHGEDARVGIGDFIAEISLLTDQDNDTDNESKVTLMTIHSAKGLEFPYVFIVGVEEELLPSALSMHSTEEIEEERRLMYVAVTRAKIRCFLSYASQRVINGQTRFGSPSRFLYEIDSRYLKLKGTLPQKAGTLKSFREPKMGIASKPRGTSFGNRQPINQARPNPAPSPGSTSDVYHSVSELHVGMKIRHPIFLVGTIDKITDADKDPRLEIIFEDGTRRILLLRFAKFTIL